MSGYTVSMSIDLIDEFCENPSQYKPWQLREAINDARTHYEHGKFYRYQELYHPEPSLKKDNPDPHEDPGCLFSFYFVSIS